MALATQGLSHKDIARELEINPRTVETHRAKMMEKIEADSIAMLCNMIAIHSTRTPLPGGLFGFGPPGVIVTRDLTVISFRGKTGRYLEPLPGTASLDLVKLIRQEILVDLRNLFKRALQSDEPVIKTGIELNFRS